MKYFILSILLFLSQVAYSCSCSCIPLGSIDEKQYNDYGLIIKGKIDRVLETKFGRIIYIKIDICFKGKQKLVTIKIESPNQSEMCGIFPKVGEQWLIFAYKNGNIYNTNLCTRTKNLNPKAWNFRKEEIEDDLKFLRRKTE